MSEYYAEAWADGETIFPISVAVELQNHSDSGGPTLSAIASEVNTSINDYMNSLYDTPTYTAVCFDQGWEGVGPGSICWGADPNSPDTTVYTLNLSEATDSNTSGFSLSDIYNWVANLLSGWF